MTSPKEERLRDFKLVINEKSTFVVPLFAYNLECLKIKSRNVEWFCFFTSLLLHVQI